MKTALAIFAALLIAIAPTAALAKGGGRGAGHHGGHSTGHAGHGGHGGVRPGGHGGGHHGRPGGHHGHHGKPGPINNNYSSSYNNTKYYGGRIGYVTLDNDLVNHLTPSQVDLMADVNAHLNSKFKR